MIMPRGEQLMMPVRPLFIVFTVLVALALNMLPWSGWVWMPDWLLLVLCFWTVRQPGKMGMGIGFALGLCMDVHQSALLGQHALSYVVAIFACRMLTRRILWFNGVIQALHLLPVFVAAHALEVLVRMLSGDAFPGVLAAVGPVLETLLWPVLSWMLLAPQRRPPDPDGNRPL